MRIIKKGPFGDAYYVFIADAYEKNTHTHPTPKWYAYLLGKSNGVERNNEKGEHVRCSVFCRFQPLITMFIMQMYRSMFMLSVICVYLFYFAPALERAVEWHFKMAIVLQNVVKAVSPDVLLRVMAYYMHFNDGICI